MSAHYIKSLDFDFTFEDDRQAESLRSQIFTFSRTDLRGLADKQFNAFEDDYFPLESLELDLGTLDADNFYQDLKRGVAKALEAQFHSLTRSISDNQLRYIRDRELAILKHFLKFGRFPWNCENLSRAEFVKLTNRVARDSQGSHWLQQELKRNGRSAERFIAQFNDANIEELLLPVMPDRVAFFRSFQSTLDPLLASVGDQYGPNWREELWLFLFRLPSAAISRDALIRKALSALLSVAEDKVQAKVGELTRQPDGTTSPSAIRLLKRLNPRGQEPQPEQSLEDVIHETSIAPSQAEKVLHRYHETLLQRLPHFTDHEIGRIIRQVNPTMCQFAISVLEDLQQFEYQVSGGRQTIRQSVWRAVSKACLNGSNATSKLVPQIFDDLGIPASQQNKLADASCRSGELQHYLASKKQGRAVEYGGDLRREAVAEMSRSITWDNPKKLIEDLLHAYPYTLVDIQKIARLVMAVPAFVQMILNERKPSEIVYLLKTLKPKAVATIRHLFAQESLIRITELTGYSQSAVIRMMSSRILSSSSMGMADEKLIEDCLKACSLTPAELAAESVIVSTHCHQIIEELLRHLKTDTPLPSSLVDRLASEEKSVVKELGVGQLDKLLGYLGTGIKETCQELITRFDAIFHDCPGISLADVQVSIARSVLRMIVAGRPYSQLDLQTSIAQDLQTNPLDILSRGTYQLEMEDLPNLLEHATDAQFLAAVATYSAPIEAYLGEVMDSMQDVFTRHHDLKTRVRKIVISRLILQKEKNEKRIISDLKFLLSGYQNNGGQTKSASTIERLIAGKDVSTKAINDTRNTLIQHHQSRLYTVSRLSDEAFSILLKRLHPGAEVAYKECCADASLSQVSGSSATAVLKLLFLANLGNPLADLTQVVGEALNGKQVTRIVEDVEAYDRKTEKRSSKEKVERKDSPGYLLSWGQAILRDSANLDQSQKDRLAVYLHGALVNQIRMIEAFSDEELIQLVRIIDRAAARNYEKCQPFLHLLTQLTQTPAGHVRQTLWQRVLKQQHQRRKRDDLLEESLNDEQIQPDALIELIKSHVQHQSTSKSIAAWLNFLAEDVGALESVTEVIRTGKLIYYERDYTKWFAACKRLKKRMHVRPVDKNRLISGLLQSGRLRQDFVAFFTSRAFGKALHILDPALAKVYDQAIKHESFVRFSKLRKAKTPMLRSLKAVCLTQLQASRLPTVDDLLTSFFESYLEDYHDFKNHVADDTPKEILDAIQRRRQQRREQVEQSWEHSPEQLSTDAPMVAPNAGVVLIGPYLTKLFSYLKYTKDEAFVSEETRQRALFMIHYLATGDSVACENDLLLAKLLCGMDISQVVPLTLTLTTEEKDEADEMLRAALNLWQKMKDTTPNGLRHNFLMRQGVLNPPTDYWILQFERETMDILVDFIPWTFKMIKYPWMDKPIQVVW
ncbi:hypothetical protein BVY04_04710 [bacterium M21]|nr:hypothetical protein BVY04_04710 [bacterium M21]